MTAKCLFRRAADRRLRNVTQDYRPCLPYNQAQGPAGQAGLSHHNPPGLLDSDKLVRTSEDRLEVRAQYAFIFHRLRRWDLKLGPRTLRGSTAPRGAASGKTDGARHDRVQATKPRARARTIIRRWRTGGLCFSYRHLLRPQAEHWMPTGSGRVRATRPGGGTWHLRRGRKGGVLGRHLGWALFR